MPLRDLGLILLALCAGTETWAQAPRIDALDPLQGPIAGGTVVTIRGANLTGASVSIDDSDVGVTQVSPSELRVTTPAHDNGYALVKVITATGSAHEEFLYVPPKLEDLPPGFITTVAGVGSYIRLHHPAGTAAIRAVGLAVDGTGNIFFGWDTANRVLRVRADGILEPFAGGGIYSGGPNGDGGPATAAWISFCRTVSIDGAGNAYIPDAGDRIRRVDAVTGIITTIAGTGEPGFSGDDGSATNARMNQPNYLVAAPDGTVYFQDQGNARIRRIATDGTIMTIAGNGVSGSSGDGGPATEAQLEMRLYEYDVGGIALDPRGILYFPEHYASAIRRIDLSTGIITTFFSGTPDVPLDRPSAISVDSAGNVYVSCRGRIIKLDSNGNVLATWGTGEYGFSEDGTPVQSMRVGWPMGLAIEPDGDILFSDGVAYRLRRINLKGGMLETVAGIAPGVVGVPGPAVGAPLTGATAALMALLSGGLLYADQESIHTFRIAATGEIAIAGGNGMNTGPEVGDGVPFAEASWVPVAFAPEPEGGWYAADRVRIVYVDPSGLTHRITESSDVGYAGDGGPAAAALFTQPWDVARDDEGNLFIADTNNNRIRRIDAATGIITTVAGGGPLNGYEGYGHGAYCGDGGPAIDACFNTPYSLAVDADGNVFVSDFANRRIRKIDTTGTISAFGAEALRGRLVADVAGGLLANSFVVIERFLPDGTSWVIAGSHELGYGFSGDGGPATNARINANKDVAPIAVDREGNVFFHDAFNARIRAVRFGAVLAPPGGKASRSPGSQSAGVSRVTTPLEARVTTSDGRPAPNVRVDFTAPASSASCVFAGGTKTVSALTDRDGRAKVTCTTTCAPGSFTVSASPLVAADRPAIGPVSLSISSSGANPVPRLDSVARSPESVFTLEAHGENFSPCSTVRWNGSSRTTTFVSVTELRAVVSGEDFGARGTAQITVATPAPGGGVSNGVAFPVGTKRRSVAH